MRSHRPICSATCGVFALLLPACAPDTPDVTFAKVRRETIVSTVRTNGKVEPLTWSAVRSQREGAVQRIPVEQGRRIARGTLLAELDTTADRVALTAAESRIARAEADLALLDEGGQRSEKVAIENDLADQRLELELAGNERAALERLVERDAATRRELDAATGKERRIEVRIASLGRKLEALVSAADRKEAESRLAGARAEAKNAKQRIEQGRIHAPMDGVLYHLDLKPGAYLKPGDLVGEVGATERVRVVIYVDEPEMGRVETGMEVKITWDARPGTEWKGVVDEVATRVVALGARQVGEVRGTIDNTDGNLRPGANINAEIQSRVAENALTIPKEAIRRRGTEIGVFVLNGENVEWRPVRIGTSSLSHAEVLEGLRDAAVVALPGPSELIDGMRVNPIVH